MSFEIVVETMANAASVRGVPPFEYDAGYQSAVLPAEIQVHAHLPTSVRPHFRSVQRTERGNFSN